MFNGISRHVPFELVHISVVVVGKNGQNGQNVVDRLKLPT